MDEARLYLLVLRCQAGDESAFTRLLELFGGRTLAHLRALVGDAAEDVQQEVWLAVYRHLPSLSNPRAFRTWLFQTTRHRAVDFLRSKKRERELFEDADIEADQIAVRNNERVDLAGTSVGVAFDQLPALHREVLRLRYEEELSYAEIALVLGCATGTIRSRLHNAKRNLQRLLESGSERAT
jgi:RNA polymerase sigma-70 factor, ECF subfamily